MSKLVSTLKRSEQLAFDPEKIRWLTRLVKQGEGLHLEFKAKASFPDKIVHEFIAFANTSGGVLLVGVSDDGKISGVKYPEEDEMLIIKSTKKHCSPQIKIKSRFIKVSQQRWVVVFDVWPSKRKPIQFKIPRSRPVTYIRYQDKTLQASHEAEEILKLKYSNRAIEFSYGETENKILKILDSKKHASFAELKMLTEIGESKLSDKVVLLAAANVIGWRPLDGEDIFSSA